MHFPTLCVDNFYPYPERVRRLALEQEFIKADDGRWPGKRTKNLHEIDEVLFNHFCDKLFSIFFDFETCGRVNWNVETSFQLIEPYDEDPNSVRNTGWIHTDKSGGVLAGVIYLTPDANLDSGTSLYRLKNEDTIDDSDVKTSFYKDGIDKNYEELLKKHNSSFEETTRFNNVYNRLAMWEGTQWHGVNSFYSKTPRLTQVFFVNKIEIDGNSPLNRWKSEWKYGLRSK